MCRIDDEIRMTEQAVSFAFIFVMIFFIIMLSIFGGKKESAPKPDPECPNGQTKVCKYVEYEKEYRYECKCK